MSETPSWRVVWCLFRCASRSGASLGPRPPRRATRRQGNADLWSAQPAAGGRPGRTPSWPVVASRPGPASSAQVSRSRACRAPPGELPSRRSLACGQHCRFGGSHRETWRRSLVGGVVRGERMCGFRTPSGRDAGRRPALRCRAPSARVAVRGFRWPPASGASLGPRPPCRATRRQGNADLWSAQPAAGGRQGRTPSWRVVCFSAGSPAFSVIRTAAWYALFAGASRSRVPSAPVATRVSLASGQRCRPRRPQPRRATRRHGNADLWSAQPAAGREGPRWPAAFTSAELGVISAGFALPRVPTGGRRSLACGQHCRSGGPHRETWRRSLVGGVVRGERMCGFRTPSGRDAGRRPALRGRVPSA